MKIASRLGLITSIVSFLIIIGPIIGFRIGLNDFRLVFTHFQFMGKGLPLGESGLGLYGLLIILGALLGIVGGILGVKAKYYKSGIAALLIGVIVLIGIYFGPISMVKTARSVPPIHDISTDMLNPPQFIAVLPLREGAPNPPEYASEFSEQQANAYPDIQTLVVANTGFESVFSSAESAIKKMGMELVASDINDGRLEAVWTSPIFAFKDDFVVRIQSASNSGTDNTVLVDVRSKSRLGRSDLGANAKRIREFLDLMQSN